MHPGRQSPAWWSSCTNSGASSSTTSPSSTIWRTMASSTESTLPPDPWSIGIYRGPTPFALTNDGTNPVLTRDDVTDVTAAFVADPFLFHDGTLWHLFFEVLNHDSQLGEIGLATSPDSHTWTYRHIVLREPFHLSYPYLLAHYALNHM